MKKVMIAYVSRTGNTAKMAEYIAEGIRFSGATAVTKKISEIKSADDLAGFDGYIFGCPTYHKDMTGGMKNFLFTAQKAELKGNAGGAFTSHTHSGEAGPMIADTMEHVFKMDMSDLGALNLKEDFIGTDDGLKACQDYGKNLAEKLAG